MLFVTRVLLSGLIFIKYVVISTVTWI